jgi:hypothetical protein
MLSTEEGLPRPQRLLNKPLFARTLCPPCGSRSGKIWRRTKGETDTLLGMAARPKLTPFQVLERLQLRLEKRMEALQRIKLAGFEIVIAELVIELDLLRRATRYLEE